MPEIKEGYVIMYGDNMTESMEKYRAYIGERYSINRKEHGITKLRSRRWFRFDCCFEEGGETEVKLKKGPTANRKATDEGDRSR